MKIEIIRRCRVRGKECLPGEIVDTDRSTALDRIGAGLAKKHVQPPPAPDAEAATAEAATAEEQEVKPKKRKKED